MKNMVAFLFIFILFAGVSFFSNVTLPMGEAKSAAFISSDQFEGFETIKNGNDYIIKVYDDIKEFYLKNEEFIKGFNLYFQSLNIKDFAKKLNAQIYQTHDVEGMIMYYGYTNMYKNFEMVGGKKVNIQIAIKEDETIVGFPLILTGF